MPRPKFKQDSLNKTIKRHDNVEEKQRENLNLLIQEFGFNPADFDMETVNPWRELCIKIAEELVPGFQERQSGRRPAYNFTDDYPIVRDYLVHVDFKDNISLVYRKRIGVVIKEIADKHKKTVGEVRTAIDRYNRHLVAYPHLHAKTCFLGEEIVDSDCLNISKKTDPQYFKP